MIAILLQKIYSLLSTYFTGIKTKLNYLYENIDAGGGGGGGGYEFDIIKELTLISDSSGNKTIEFDDISNYTYIYVLICENNSTLINTQDHARIWPLTVSEIGNNSITRSTGYLWDSGNVSVTITKTSLTCISYSNQYHNMYAKIIGSNTSLM